MVTTKHMEAIFQREDIVYAIECKISVRVDKKGETHYTPKIKKIMDRHKSIFEPIPLGAPPDRGFDHMI